MTIAPHLREKIHAPTACLSDIRALAGELASLDAAQLEPMLLAAAQEGDDHAVSRLLQVSAYNGVCLDPEVLCSCLGVCEDLVDSAPCFALQSGNAVPPLLAAAADKALSIERQLYASRLAVELTIRFDLDRQPVRKVLWKQEHQAFLPDYRVLIREALDILEQKPALPLAYSWTDLTLSDVLPEHKQKAVVGGHYTVRRAVPRLGRNEPCHCGSRKKYKKCCYAKDQALLRDASAFAGTTRSALKANPGLVDEPTLIYDMRAYELKKPNPADLGPKQLPAGYHAARGYGLYERAFAMLVEWQRRSGDDDTFDPGHYEDLIDEVLAAGD